MRSFAGLSRPAAVPPWDAVHPILSGLDPQERQWVTEAALNGAPEPDPAGRRLLFGVVWRAC